MLKGLLEVSAPPLGGTIITKNKNTPLMQPVPSFDHQTTHYYPKNRGTVGCSWITISLLPTWWMLPQWLSSNSKTVQQCAEWPANMAAAGQCSECFHMVNFSLPPQSEDKQFKRTDSLVLLPRLIIFICTLCSAFSLTLHRQQAVTQRCVLWERRLF